MKKTGVIGGHGFVQGLTFKTFLLKIIIEKILVPEHSMGQKHPDLNYWDQIYLSLPVLQKSPKRIKSYADYNSSSGETKLDSKSPIKSMIQKPFGLIIKERIHCTFQYSGINYYSIPNTLNQNNN